MFGKSQPTKRVPLKKKEYECCQCHKLICHVYVKPEEEDNFDDAYPMCWPCFNKLCDEIRELKKKGEN